MSKATSVVDAMDEVVRKFGEGSFALGGAMIFIGGIGLLVFVPYYIARIVLAWSQSVLPIGVHAVVLLAFFAILGYWSWMISGDRGNRLFHTLYGQGLKWPFLFSVALLIFAMVCFASLSSTLSDLGLSRFEPAIGRGEFHRLQDFYGWH